MASAAGIEDEDEEAQAKESGRASRREQKQWHKSTNLERDDVDDGLKTILN